MEYSKWLECFSMMSNFYYIYCVLSLSLSHTHTHTHTHVCCMQSNMSLRNYKLGGLKKLMGGYTGTLHSATYTRPLTQISVISTTEPDNAAWLTLSCHWWNSPHYCPFVSISAFFNKWLHLFFRINQGSTFCIRIKDKPQNFSNVCMSMAIESKRL